MKYKVVSSMKEEISLSEFSELMNQAKQILEISTRLSFFDARILGNMLLMEEIQYYCRPIDETENYAKNYRYGLDLVLEIIQNKIHKTAIEIKRKVIENMCENIYYYIFSLS